MTQAWMETTCETSTLGDLRSALRLVNERIWDVEEKLREREREKAFGEEFVQLARFVYHYNDDRARLKKLVNEATGSRLVEEKSHKECEQLAGIELTGLSPSELNISGSFPLRLLALVSSEGAPYAGRVGF